MNQSENNFKITLRRRELKSTVPFLLRSTQLYTRHSQVERSGMNLKLKLMMLMSVCSHSQIMGCSPAGSSVHGILQARLLEWVTMPSSRGSSQPRDRTQVSRIAGDSLRLSYQGSSRILGWVVYPVSRESSGARNQTGVSHIAGRFFTS